MFRNPIIIIGMHRSGTSLIARTLKLIGIFMGAELNNHEESTFFLNLNQYLFHLTHARWDNPGPMEYLLQAFQGFPQIHSEILSCLKNALASPDSAKYWGPIAYETLRKMDLYSFFSTIEQPWGWKDPRNSYTLPLWLTLFPEAKILHVYRNGVDVANSLVTREKGRANKLQNQNFSFRCLEFNSAFDLWSEYVGMCLRLTEKLSQGQAFSLCYEEFLVQPVRHLAELSNFLDINVDEGMIAQATHNILPNRAYSFRGKPELEGHYEERRHHRLMVSLGYADLRPSNSEPGTRKTCQG